MLPQYAQPPGSGHATPRGVHTGENGVKMAKTLMKVARGVHHLKLRTHRMPRRKIKRFF